MTDGNGRPPDRIVERLRRARTRALANKTHTFEIPGWDGALFARYKSVGWERAFELSRVLSGPLDADEDLKLSLDLLIDACDALLIRDGGEMRPLGQVLGGDPPDSPPVRYVKRAADLLEVEPHEETARAVVLAVFGLMPEPEAAVSAQATQILAWLNGARREVDANLVGESPPTSE
jgi:hypothetical protein